MKDDLVPGNLEWADDKKDRVVFVPTPAGSVNMYDGKATDRFKQDEVGQWVNPDEYLMLNNGIKYPQEGPWFQKIDYKNVTISMLGLHQGLNITWFGNHMSFWLSIMKAKNAIFSRRYEIKGKIIFGYSIRLRILSKDII